MTEAAPPNTGYSVSVLTTHTVDTQPSLLVAFDNQRYLFNAPEAISRVALQNKVGLRKVGHVFLGELEQSAGLPGFILSSVEAGQDKIQVVGPEGTDHLIASCRFFTRRDRLSLKVTSPTLAEPGPPTLPPPIHADSNLIVHAFTLARSTSPAQADEPMPDAAHSAAADGLAAEQVAPTLKRKRSGSPTPPLRAKSPPGESSSAPTFNPSNPSFNPSHLRGADASAWRSLVLHDMFRGEAFAPRPAVTPPSPSGRRIPTPAYLPQPLPPFARDFSPSAASYLCIGPRKRGKFLPEKAKALGVKPGKAFSRLIAGGKVWVRAEENAASEKAEAKPTKKESKKERADRLKKEKELEEAMEAEEGKGEGRWVDAVDCMEAGEDASAFLVLNIPSPAYLPSLASTIPPTLFQAGSLPAQTIFRAVFLFAGPAVIFSPTFQAYIANLQSVFPSLALHVSSADCVSQGKNEVVFGPSALLNLRLGQLDTSMFQLPRYSFLPDLSTLALPAPLSPLSHNSHFSSTLEPLPPSKSPFGSVVREVNFTIPSPEADLEAARLKGHEKPAETLERAAAAWAEYVDKAKQAKAAVEQEERERAAVPIGNAAKVEGELVVTPLGTGSAIPSKYRNVSATLLHLPPRPDVAEQEYLLLDAGEGTWGQIARRFGEGNKEKGEPSKEDVLRGIKLLFLSHLHQDHHAGIATILRHRAKLSPPPSSPLTIVCPPNARTYLFEQQQLFDLGLYERDGGKEVRFIDNPLLEPGKTLQTGSRAYNTLEDLKTRLGLSEVTAVPVLHRCRAWGVVIGHSSGWKVVFSGDTMPCAALAEAGKGASLLVHEATIEDDMPEVAEAKGHSTFGQAIDVAVKMEARHLLLTHFSARYPKLPPLSTYFSSSSAETADATAHRPVVATAFDLMTLRLADFWKVERYRDAMDALLSWDEAEEDGEDKDELSGKEKTVTAGSVDAEKEDAVRGKSQGSGKKREDGKMSKRQEKKAKRVEQEGEKTEAAQAA
ncbi:hypothetical protein JCM8097_001668 [Rhodosporidiobolus ruineniae]